jgi:hypothetical protein
MTAPLQMSEQAPSTKVIPCQCFTRTVGYYAVISQMNKGKQEEVRQRKLAQISDLKNNLIEEGRYGTEDQKI